MPISRQGMLLACLLVLATIAPATAQPIDIGIVSAPTRELITIAVTPFEARGARLNEELFQVVIMNDLELSGFFQPPRNAAFAEQTHRLDLARNAIQFAEWYRIGATHLVKGNYTVNPVTNDIEAEVRLYDTVGQRSMLGRQYTGYKLEDARRLAHRISNDIIQQITGYPGVADTRIMFIQQSEPMGRSKQVSLIDADGQNLTTLTGPGELTATPTWGARGTEVYFTTYRDYNPDLIGMRLSDRRTWWISRQGGLNISPSWSETNERIALTLSRDGNSELYTLGRDGSDMQRLTNNRSIDSSPEWSPDGSQLVYQSDRTGSPQVYIMDVRTRQERRLTFNGTYNDAPSWSPDGRWIAYHRRSGGEFSIYLIRPDGTEERMLTQGEDPTWAPNSMLLAFCSDRTDTRQVYSVFIDGSNLRQLTNTRFGAQSPAWSPARPQAD